MEAHSDAAYGIRKTLPGHTVNVRRGNKVLITEAGGGDDGEGRGASDTLRCARSAKLWSAGLWGGGPRETLGEAWDWGGATGCGAAGRRAMHHAHQVHERAHRNQRALTTDPPARRTDVLRSA